MNKLQADIPTASMGYDFPSAPAAVQEKFHRIIQLQEGNEQHDTFCPSGSLSMDLSDVTVFCKSYSS